MTEGEENIIIKGVLPLHGIVMSIPAIVTPMLILKR